PGGARAAGVRPGEAAVELQSDPRAGAGMGATLALGTGGAWMGPPPHVVQGTRLAARRGSHRSPRSDPRRAAQARPAAIALPGAVRRAESAAGDRRYDLPDVHAVHASAARPHCPG